MLIETVRLESINRAAATLVERFASRTALVSVIGLGYVGLPLALRFSEAGFRVLGFDIDAAKAAASRTRRTSTTCASRRRSS